MNDRTNTRPMTKRVRTIRQGLFGGRERVGSPRHYRPADAYRSPIASAAGLCGLLLVGAAVAALAGCQRDATGKEQAEQAKPVPVMVAAVELRPVETTIDVVGSLKGWEDVEVGAKKSGRVVKSLHDVGDRVAPGELLVQMDTVNADLAIQQAEKRLLSELAKLGLTKLPSPDFDVSKLPAVVQAQVTVARTQQHFEREQTLLERKVNTIESYQNAEFDLKEAKAAAENAELTARATLANAFASQVELDVARQAKIDMEIRAPQPSRVPQGVKEALRYAIVKRDVSEGQMLREGDEVMHLVVDNPLRMWGAVPERFSPYVKAGQEARLRVSSHADRTFPGRLAWVNPSVDAVSRSFLVEVAVPNDERALRPGGFAKASIVVREQSQRTVVPIEAVIHFAGVTKVYVARDGKAVDVPVVTGVEGPGWIEVSGELDSAAQVIVSGQSQLADGTAILVREATKTTQQAERTASREEVNH
jgi:membrane fusion protein, multidrug efflux system